MNYTSDQLFHKFLLEKKTYLNENEKDDIIEDILFLQNLLKPLGILNKANIDQLNTLDDHSLYMIHTWQNELYGIKYFKQCSRNPPST